MMLRQILIYAVVMTIKRVSVITNAYDIIKIKFH